MAAVRDSYHARDRWDRARDHGAPSPVADRRLNLMTVGRSRGLAAYDIRPEMSLEDLVDDEEAL